MQLLQTEHCTRWAFIGALIAVALSWIPALLLAIMVGGMLGGGFCEQIGLGVLVPFGILLGFALVMLMVGGAAAVIGAVVGMLLQLLVSGTRRACRL